MEAGVASGVFDTGLVGGSASWRGEREPESGDPDIGVF